MADKRLRLGATLNLISVMQEAYFRMGLTKDQLAEKTKGKEGMDIVDVVLGLVSDVLHEAFKDYDRKTKTPGPFLLEVIEAFGEVIGKTTDEMLSSEIDEEIFGAFEDILRAEARGRLGKFISTTTLPFRRILSSAIEVVLTKVQETVWAFAGGQSNGGTMPSLIGLRLATEEPSETSIDFPLDESSISSELPEPTLS